MTAMRSQKCRNRSFHGFVRPGWDSGLESLLLHSTGRSEFSAGPDSEGERTKQGYDCQRCGSLEAHHLQRFPTPLCAQ